MFVVNTEPSGASVRTTNQMACDATPCSFKMSRKSEFEVTITKAGYRTWQGHITHKVATAGGAGMAGNVILGGLIGAAVDVGTGAMMDLVPNPLTVKLEAVSTPGDLARTAVPASQTIPQNAGPQPAPRATETAQAGTPSKSACGMIPQQSGAVKLVPCR